MATTSTSDSRPWTSRRVRGLRLVAGGAWLTIAIIPSNDQFQHTLGPDGSARMELGCLATSLVADRVTKDGQDTQLRQ